MLSLAYPTIGALIASRLPTNRIGWIFCGVGLLYAVRRFTVAYADYVAARKSRVAWGRVRGLVLVVDRDRGADAGGRLPDAAVPGRTDTVSSVADCGMGGDLREPR